MTTRLKWLLAATLLGGGAWFVLRPAGAAPEPEGVIRRPPPRATATADSRTDPLTPAPAALRERGLAATNFLPADFDGLPPPEPRLSPEEEELVRIFREGARGRTAETTVFFGPGPKNSSIDLEPRGETR